MLKLVKLKKSNFYTMMISAAAIILAISADTLFRANNELFFNDWVAVNNLEISDTDQLYQVFMTSLMADYFFRLIVPVVFGLQTYFAFVRSGVGVVYKAVWAVIAGGMFIVTLLNFDVTSPVYYITAIAYVIIIVSLLRIKHNSTKNIGG